MDDTKNWEMFLRGITKSDADYENLCREIKELFYGPRIFETVIITGPGCSGKSTLGRLFFEIIQLNPPGLHTQWFDNPLSVKTSNIHNNVDDAMIISTGQTIECDQIDPFVLESLIKEIPAIISWIKGRGL